MRGVMPWIIPGFLEKMEVVDSKGSYTRVKGLAVSRLIAWCYGGLENSGVVRDLLPIHRGAMLRKKKKHTFIFSF